MFPENAERIGDEDFPPVREGQDRSLWGWIFFSGLLHAAVVGLVLFSFSLAVRRTVNYPVYTVDLVGGEKIGRSGVGTEVAPAPPPKEVKQAKPEPLPKARAQTDSKVTVAKAEKVTVAKAEKVTVAKAEKVTVAKAEKEPKEEKAPAKLASKELPGDVREKLIQAALDRVKQRATESGANVSSAQEGKKPESLGQKKDASTGGAGEGSGAAALGRGGTGGGIEKGIEFVTYYNRMRQLLKENWTWIGRRSDLEVTVRFGISDSGEIFGLRIVQGSGDSSFDQSVIRAVRKVNPLPSPPEAYRSDFRDVEMVFRPEDLRG